MVNHLGKRLLKHTSKSLTARALIAVTAILLIPLSISAIYIANNYIHVTTLKTERDLTLIASEVDSALQPYVHQIHEYKDTPDLSPSQKVSLINKLIQSKIEEIAKAHPGVELGYYDVELNSVCAVAPNFSPSKLRSISRDEPYFKAYESGRPEFSYASTSFGWEGRSIYNLTHPIILRNETIGHTWASIKTGDMHFAAWLMAAKAISVGLILWLLVLFYIRRTLHRFETSLQTFSDSINQNNFDGTPSSDFPELEPVLTKIKAYASELKHSNDDLNKLNLLFTSAIEGISESFYVLNLEDQFVYVNSQFEKLTKNSKPELIGKAIWDVFPMLQSKDQFIPFRNAILQRTPLHWEFRNHDRWFEIHAYPFGEGITVFIRDITERKALEENAFELASILENAEIAIVSRTVDGIITDWNPGAVRLFGYNREDVIGKHILSIIAPEAHQISQKAIETTKKGEPFNPFESVGIRMDGSKINLSVVLTAVRNHSGKVVGISSIMTDITELKQSQREFARLDRLNLIAQMAAGIGHEVRNPMTTVRGFLQMLGTKKELAAYNDYFSLMITEIDRANSIITEFLSLSRNRPIDLKSGNLNYIISKLFPILQADAFNSAKDISLDLSEVPEIIMDENEIRQLALNLVRNALEATPEGTKVIIRTSVEGGRVVLAVSDQGKGIKPDVLQKIGTPFFTTKDTGTGIGLSICYGIAERHNAKIDINTSSTGSTFYVSFPAEF